MRKKTSPIWKLPTEDLKKLVQSSITFKEVLMFFGLHNKGANFTTLKRRLNEENIDYSHISKSASVEILKRICERKIPLKDVLTKDSSYSRGKLKKRLISEGMLEYKCCGEGCKLSNIWLEKKLVLVLDHINGDSRDNRIENLRFLCPNCNSQTETFCGKNLKRVYNCPICGKAILKTSSTCRHCSPRKKKFEITKGELQSLMTTNSWTTIGKIFGVSDNAVRKRAKKFGLI